MTTFEYSGFDGQGRARRGLVEADGAKDARKRLAAEGILAERVQAAGGKPRRAAGRKAFGMEARTMFYRELASLLQAGLALVPAMEVILQAPELDRTRAMLAAARDLVREGVPLSGALERATGNGLTAFESAVLAVGEKTGGMGEALTELADFLEEQERLRGKLATTLLYPCVVAGMAVVLGGGVLTFMLPMVQSLFAEAHLEVGGLTAGLLVAGRVLGWLLLGGAAAAAAGTWFVRRRAAGSAAVRVAVDRRLWGLPVVGKGRRDLASLRFVRVLEFLLKRGVGLVEAVPLAGRASGSAWVAEEAAREAEALRQGKALADVVRGIRPLHPSLAAWVQAGEAGGDLPGLLKNAGNRFQQSWDRLAARGVMGLEIGMTLAVGLCVALIALAVLLPILQINKGFMP